MTTFGSKTIQNLDKTGFSLLELSIVLTILGIMLSGILTLITEYGKKSSIEASWLEMEKIGEALSNFVSANGRLPCPAPVTAKRNDVKFGREAETCDDTTNGINRVEYPPDSGNFVIMGGVPFYSLSLPDKYLSDAWNRRYLYAVSENLIAAADGNSSGTIEIVDNEMNLITKEAAWTLVTHGPSGKGGYSAKTAVISSVCDSKHKDRDNCDHSDGRFTDAVFNDGENNADNFFDDYILWQTIDGIFTMVGGSSNGTNGSNTPSGATGPGIRKVKSSFPLAPDGKEWADAIVCNYSNNYAVVFRLDWYKYPPTDGMAGQVLYRYLYTTLDYSVTYDSLSGSRTSYANGGVNCGNYADVEKVYYTNMSNNSSGSSDKN